MGQVRRRQFLIATGALLAARLADAQPPQKLRRIGILSPAVNGSAQQQRLQRWLRDALQRVGYEEGKNVVIEWRFSNREVADMLVNAEELVRLKVELIIASSNEAVVQAKLSRARA